MVLQSCNGGSLLQQSDNMEWDMNEVFSSSFLWTAVLNACLWKNVIIFSFTEFFVLLLLRCWVMCPTSIVIGLCHSVPEQGRYRPGPAGIGPIPVQFWCVVVIHMVVFIKMMVYICWYIIQRIENLFRSHFYLYPQVLGDVYYEGKLSTLRVQSTNQHGLR